jgi:acyl-CoA synthetase (AMP-forming)/AMP-acid ligase II
MNCVTLFEKNARQNPEFSALWTVKTGVLTFGELADLSSRVQTELSEKGLQVGDSVLLLDMPGPRLFATIIALLASGATVLLVEPWLSTDRIEAIINSMQPRYFIGGNLARLWALRVPAIRKIPSWLTPSSLLKASGKNSLRVENVDDTSAAIIAFTSGTTGNPKGVMRSHGYLRAQYRTLASALHLEELNGPELCIFPNFALANLAANRCTLLVSDSWNESILKKLDHLSASLQPVSMTCGPAFLKQISKYAKLPNLKAAHIGGALTANTLFEESMKRWPATSWTHVYGGSEAEPVSICDAKESVTKSRAQGYYHAINIGRPVSEIKYQFSADNGLWVTGEHVCKEYVQTAAEESLLNKKKDPDGTIWHFMGDRIIEDSPGENWWYSGRMNQALGDFQLEQKIYAKLNSDNAFLHRDSNNELHLLGENILTYKHELLSAFPLLSKIHNATIYRDARHRARIDRKKSLKKAGGL